jgi:hypothetical protein
LLESEPKITRVVAGRIIVLARRNVKNGIVKLLTILPSL